MYQGFRNRDNRGGRPQFGRGRSFGGKRPIKTFNPTDFINTPQREAQKVEYTVKNSFSDFEIVEKLRSNILEKGYKTPTPIQDQAIPLILEGRDLIGIANTGTGKTAAFLIPLVNKVIKDERQKVLIITPTRELAVQIKDELTWFTRGLRIFWAICIGGSHIGRQKDQLRNNPNFVIGTPGRIQDLIRTRNLDLSSFGSIVLDEADRMVDMGFIGSIKQIISLLSPERQSLFFSATIDGKIREILNGFVRNPATVSVKSGDSSQNVEQKIVNYTDPEDRMKKLKEFLMLPEFDKVLIFGRTKHGVQKLADVLTREGIRSDSIHGDKRQNQRQRTLDNFKRNNFKVLTATDVAARGLDISAVSHVINFDLPESQEAYVHRIGRTGRADKKGIAITFIQGR